MTVKVASALAALRRGLESSAVRARLQPGEDLVLFHPLVSDRCPLCEKKATAEIAVLLIAALNAGSALIEMRSARAVFACKSCGWSISACPGENDPAYGSRGGVRKAES